MFRRRPLMRAAVVGGGAYVVGKKVAQSKQHTADQDAQLAAQQQAPPAPQAAPAASEDDKMAQLKQLKELLDTGVLTQAEFDAQKQKILQSM
jgi:membrane protease subunit (stomatin/prohibitin family)